MKCAVSKGLGTGIDHTVTFCNTTYLYRCSNPYIVSHLYAYFTKWKNRFMWTPRLSICGPTVSRIFLKVFPVASLEYEHYVLILRVFALKWSFLCCVLSILTPVPTFARCVTVWPIVKFKNAFMWPLSVCLSVVSQFDSSVLVISTKTFVMCETRTFTLEAKRRIINALGNREKRLLQRLHKQQRPTVFFPILSPAR
jgi:hypothetical protein